MKPFLPILCIFATLMATGCAEELMFFADDHYKAVGEPELKVSAVNPILEAGSNSTLQITLENVGLIQELIPTQSTGDEQDTSSEAKEEMHSVDAVNLTASLPGNGPVVVTSGPCNLASLPSGGLAQINFEIMAGEGAVGWYNLVLDLEYEHQIDMKVGNGSSTSLYQPVNISQKISILVQGADRSWKVEGIRSDLYPGANGTILAVIKNAWPVMARNCSARLVEAPPFRSAFDRYNLGDVMSGQAVVAKLQTVVDEKAAPGKCHLDCEIIHDNRTFMVSIPVVLEKAPSSLPASLVVAVLILASAGCLVILWLKMRYDKRARRRKRRPVR